MDMFIITVVGMYGGREDAAGTGFHRDECLSEEEVWVMSVFCVS